MRPVEQEIAEVKQDAKRYLELLPLPARVVAAPFMARVAGLLDRLYKESKKNGQGCNCTRRD